MSFAFPFFASNVEQTAGLSTSGATAHTNVTASASTHTKGSWVELSASTPFAASGVYVFLRVASTTATRFLVDLGIGAAASEAVLIGDIYTRGESDRGHQAVVFFPVSIPVGVRLAARCQAHVGSAVVVCGIRLVRHGWGGGPVYSGVDTLGADASNSDMIAYQTSGTSNNTKGAWSELENATLRPYRGLIVVTAQYTGSGSTNSAFDIGVGAASSEEVFIGDIYYFGNVNTPAQQQWTYHPISVPVGSRLSYRGQTDNVNAGNYFICGAYGLY